MSLLGGPRFVVAAEPGLGGCRVGDPTPVTLHTSAFISEEVALWLSLNPFDPPFMGDY
jgi:hypothetical protein